VKLGIVGCGTIGCKRAAAARDHRVVMVADLDPELARSLALATGARAVSDWRDVLASNTDGYEPPKSRMALPLAENPLAPRMVTALPR
jgi:predicted dehydrogenase